MRRPGHHDRLRAPRNGMHITMNPGKRPRPDAQTSLHGSTAPPAGRSPLASDPVGRLDLEHVSRPIAPDRPERAPEAHLSVRVLAEALLRPDEVERRTRAVLPAEHRRAAQRCVGEVRVGEGERACRPRTIGIHLVRVRRLVEGDGTDVTAVLQLATAARSGELPERSVVAAGDERLRVKLHREVRG